MMSGDVALVDAFDVPRRSLVAKIGGSDVMLGRIRSADLGPGVGIAAKADDGFGLIYQVGDLAPHDLWMNGRHHRVGANSRGTMHILDLSDTPVGRLPAEFDSLNVQIPRSALDDLAELSESRPISELRVPSPWETRDPVVTSMERGLLHALAQPGETIPLVQDQLVLALVAHVASAYGGMRSRSRAATRGSLAPWQERRAKALMAHGFGESLSLSDIAVQCHLSPSHFSRAFKATTGVTPSAWLRDCRIERAKSLLREGGVPLADVALRCGFADQSHFTRLFAREVKLTPGEWRRTYRIR